VDERPQTAPLLDIRDLAGSPSLTKTLIPTPLTSPRDNEAKAVKRLQDQPPPSSL